MLILGSCANYNEAEQICEIILSASFCDKDLEMKITMHQCRILVFKGENMQCVARGIGALTSMGELDLPPILDNPEMIPSYEMNLWNEILYNCRQLGFAKTFATLPPLNDNFILAVQSLLVEITAPLAWCAPQLLQTVPLVGIVLTLKYGICVQTAFHVPISAAFLTASYQL
jgi:hypothetical protein